MIRVVDVVIADKACRGDMAIPHRQLVAVDGGEKVQKLGGVHELCFSLQVMQTRVQGIAFRRAGAIGSPQSRQIP